MSVAVIYPKVSLEETTGRIARWLVAEGDRVTEGQVLFEIDDDKAAVEVQAPAGGIVAGLAPEGATVDVGSAVATIRAEGEDGAAAPAAADPVTEVAADPAARPAPGAAQALPAVLTDALGAGRRASRGPNPTPLARRLAREHGVSLDGVAGTGPRGRVQKVDVLARLAAAPAAPAGDAGALNGAWLARGDGLPMVLLHGYASDLNGWRGLFAGARPDRPVLALDLPAHGGSPRGVPADLDGVAAAVEAGLSAAGVSACVLVGHSFGAAAAARVAARGRVAVKALGLLAPAGLGPAIDAAFVTGILRARRAESLRPWLERLVEDPRTISAGFLKAVVEARADDGLTAAMAAFAERFFPDGTQAVSIRGDLAALPMPVRVIFGRQDRILPFDATRGLPGAVGLHGIDACGHVPHLEHPALVRRLLGELAASAG